jgi:hypothetical protein
MVGIGNMDKNVNLNLYNSIMETIDGKMKKRLESPLHLVAYFLNPYYSYTDSSIFGDEEVMDGFISAVETFYHDDYDKAKKKMKDTMTSKIESSMRICTNSNIKVATLQNLYQWLAVGVCNVFHICKLLKCI